MRINPVCLDTFSIHTPQFLYLSGDRWQILWLWSAHATSLVMDCDQYADQPVYQLMDPSGTSGNDTGLANMSFMSGYTMTITMRNRFSVSYYLPTSETHLPSWCTLTKESRICAFWSMTCAQFVIRLYSLGSTLCCNFVP